MSTQRTYSGYVISNKEHDKFLFIDNSFVYYAIEKLEDATIFYNSICTLNLILNPKRKTFMSEYLKDTLGLSKILEVEITYKLLEK